MLSIKAFKHLRVALAKQASLFLETLALPRQIASLAFDATRLFLFLFLE
jgi:hypothetical protein